MITSTLPRHTSRAECQMTPRCGLATDVPAVWGFSRHSDATLVGSEPSSTMAAEFAQ